jgi:hypothetical protein
MKLSLRNLLRRRSDRGLARRSTRPAKTTRLDVEQLQDRVVPSFINVLPYTFNLPGAGPVHFTSENFATGAIAGTFHDLSSGINVAVAGQLTALGPRVDKIVFVGAGSKPLEHETVNFVGEVVDYRPFAPEMMSGVLTENYWVTVPWGPPLHWSVTHAERAWGV